VCSAGATLRFFVISPFTGDFAYRLNVAAVVYAGSRACMCAREHASDDAFEEAVVQPRRMDSFWFGGVLVFLSLGSLLLLSGQRSR
jgi:hypothetical protein